MSFNISIKGGLVSKILPYMITVDVLNGFSLLYFNVNLQISLILKLIILFVILIYSYFKERNYFVILVTLLIFSVTSAFYHFKSQQVFGVFFQSLSDAVKFLSCLFFIFYFMILEKNGELSEGLLKKITLVGLLTIYANVALGVMGFGFSTYGNYSIDEGGVGVKGFFFAGNELGPALICLFSSQMILFKNWSMTAKFISAVVAVIAAVLISTKTAILGIVLLVCWYFSKNIPIYFRLICYSVALFSIFSLAIDFEYFIRTWEGYALFDKLLFQAEKVDILYAITSGRTEYATEILSIYFQGIDVGSLLFGIGRSSVNYYGRSIIEVDFLDAFVWFGALGGIAFFASYLCFFSLIYWRKVKNSEKSNFSLNLALITTISAISGHVFYSGLVAIPLATLVACFILPKSNESI
ncbi:O-antigen ligase family protein [Vibrio cyclitrophicus]